MNTIDATKLAQDLAIQKQEHEKLEQRFQVLESQKIRNYNLLVEELQKTHQLALKVKELETESLMAATLGEAKKNI